MESILSRLAGVASGLVLIASASFSEAFECTTGTGCEVGAWNQQKGKIDYVKVPKGHIVDPAAGWVLGSGTWERVD